MKSKPKLMCNKCFKRPKYKAKTGNGQLVIGYCEHNQVASIYNTLLDQWSTVNPVTLEQYERNIQNWANYMEQTQNNIINNLKYKQ